MTISANGDQEDSGILWESTGDYNAGTPGTLHAYDASNLANELWNSDRNPDRDRMPPVTKFAPPTVANGKVYVPSFANVVTVYGLFSAAFRRWRNSLHLHRGTCGKLFSGCRLSR